MDTLKSKFIDWLSHNYKISTSVNVDGITVIQVFLKTDKKFAEKIPIEFEELNLNIHFPDFIYTDKGKYVPGTDEYSSEIEFFTIFIEN